MALSLEMVEHESMHAGYESYTLGLIFAMTFSCPYFMQTVKTINRNIKQLELCKKEAYKLSIAVLLGWWFKLNFPVDIRYNFMF